MSARDIEDLDPSGALRPNAALVVRTRLDELRSLAQAALSPDATKAQHDMRIAAKRLRYVLEVFAPCFGEETDAARRVAKSLQFVLGDLHDCDLMLSKVENIPSLHAVVSKGRQRLFRSFVESWQAAESRGTWAALDTL